MREIREKALAKLNLSLDVTARREDGYHDMLMVMQTVSLCDDVRLRLRSDGVITVATDLRYLPCDERNIAWKAATAFFAATDRKNLGVDITIKKHIPVCAGMGGGSADGAAVLRGLNTAVGAPMNAMQLEELAATVGSDIPFCIRGGTALAEGRGEILTALPPLPDCHIVICKPRFSVSTPVLFAELDKNELRTHPDTPGMLDALQKGELTGVCRRLGNVFEDVLPTSRDDVDEVKRILTEHGALGCLMTGTGSAVYGIFDSTVKAFEAKARLLRRYREVFMAVPRAALSL